MLTPEQLYHCWLHNGRNISTDTRKLRPDSIFWALRGENFDGNQYVPQALAAGCIYAVTDDASIASVHPKSLLVDDTLTALQQTANYACRQMRIPVLAITGSNGKTTTKELLHRVLSIKYKTHSTPGNFNNHIGLPLTILSSPPDTELLLLEMGDNHPGEIYQLCLIAEPQYGYITNVGKDHIEGFGSFEANKRAKKELFDYLAQTRGTAFIPASDYELLKMSEEIENRILLGQSSTLQMADFQDAYLTYLDPAGHTHKTLMTGHYNLANIQAAYSIGLYFGIKETAIHEAIVGYNPQNLRSQVLENEKFTVFLDAYNANPSSMLLALEHFYAVNTRPHKFFIIGDMRELGAESRSEHDAIVAWVEKHKLNGLFVGEEFGKSLPAGATQHCRDAEQAMSVLKNIPFHNHQILIKASRGIRLEKILPFFGFTTN